MKQRFTLVLVVALASCGYAANNPATPIVVVKPARHHRARPMVEDPARHDDRVIDRTMAGLPTTTVTLPRTR